MKKFWQNVAFRRWLYGVLLAVVVFLGGEGVINSVQQENITGIVEAVLIAGPLAGGFGLAINKATPAKTDESEDPAAHAKHGD